MNSTPQQDAQGQPASMGCLSVDAMCQILASPGQDMTRVARHIERCDECREVLAACIRPSSHAEEGTGTFTVRVGEVLCNRYSIVRRIGMGGMGEVYEALDRELDERIALKTLTATRLDNASAIERFKRELKLARRIGHPNVCRLFDFGFHSRVLSTGTEIIPFITMEFIDGRPLSESIPLQRDCLQLERATKILEQLLSGLAALHADGIVHRDLKPHNVLLVNGHSEVPRVVLIDFGLARILGQHGGAASASTAFAGSLEYASPEQLNGAEVTAASDIYALGIVLFEMLVGQRPFTGPDPLSEATRRLVDKPQRLAMHGHFPAAWEQFIETCLAREPADRFATAQVARTQLLRLPRKQETASTRPYFAQWSRIAVAVAVLGLTASGAGALLIGRTPPTPAMELGTVASDVKKEGPIVQTRPAEIVPATPSTTTTKVTADKATEPVLKKRRPPKRATVKPLEQKTAPPEPSVNAPVLATPKHYEPWVGSSAQRTEAKDTLVSPYRKTP